MRGAAVFVHQRRGTVRISRAFGPVMFLWFVTIAVLGAVAIAKRPEVLSAVDPRLAVHFLARRSLEGFFALGFIFLVATGGEALYADMGRFGKRPMRAGWLDSAAWAVAIDAKTQISNTAGCLSLRKVLCTNREFLRSRARL